MSDMPKRDVIADSIKLEIRIDTIAKLLWENAGMVAQWEGRAPEWHEVKADREQYFQHETEVLAYAEALIGMDENDRAELLRVLAAHDTDYAETRAAQKAADLKRFTPPASGSASRG